MSNAETVAAYIGTLSNWQLIPVDKPYGHMGATLTDAVLQSGITYETVVLPRVNRLVARHPEARTTGAFSKVLEQEGAESVLDWKEDSKKVRTLKKLIAFLQREGIDTEDELRAWLESPQNLIRLQVIDGIGEKTAHYLQILVGIQGIAIDRHLFEFLARAGVPCRTYEEAHQVLTETAILLGVNASDLDYSVWKYMSKAQAEPQRGLCASR